MIPITTHRPNEQTEVVELRPSIPKELIVVKTERLTDLATSSF